MRTDIQDETALDGVRYALLREGESLWRLGAVTPLWREEMPLLGSAPDAAAFSALAAKGVYVNCGQPAPLAVMCCGLGSAWPGMGRELYDNFPAARQAMDEIASFADWDILSLMDEPDADIINQTRNQIPYLFLLEYAQWKQLVSLGLRPDVICGHSLGELVALCLAGVYDVHAAWILLDTRARHMAALETDLESSSGMLAVSADFRTVSEILAQYPDLRISNCNTPRQYILGGPRPVLLVARKTLRRRRIPAFLLNVSIAFHNPAMRVLRDISLRRLNALEMKAPDIPMLSCVTSGLYPQGQEEICRYIADLDENTVEWTKSVQAMRGKSHIQTFLELGPRETLCGLVTEIDPEPLCLAASRQGHETRAMRQLCARLFALGYLQEIRIKEQKSARMSFQDGAQPKADSAPFVRSDVMWPDLPENELRIILDLIAAASGFPAGALKPDLDLRHDLNLRSSRFPQLLQEAEQCLKRTIDLENMFQLATVGDLVRFLGGISGHKIDGSPAQKKIPALASGDRFNGPPIYICKWAENGAPEQIRLNPLRRGLVERPAGLVALCVFDAAILPQIWEGLAAFKCDLAIPAPLIEQCAVLKKFGSNLIPLNCGLNPQAGELACALSGLRQEHGNPSGILFIPPPQMAAEKEDAAAPDMAVLRESADFVRSLPDYPWFCVLQRAHGDIGTALPPLQKTSVAFYDAVENALVALPWHAIYWADSRTETVFRNRGEAGDMLAWDILHNSASKTVWLPATVLEKTVSGYCGASPCMEFVWPDSAPPLQPGPCMFQGACQYSRFADSVLSTHGGGSFAPCAQPHKADFSASPWLPPGYVLKALLVSARLVSPWLKPCAFLDLRINSLPFLPDAVTRECRPVARAVPWIPQAGIMTRICHVNMAVREISPNGRHLHAWRTVCDGSCLLAPDGAIPEIFIPKPLQAREGRKCDRIANICYDLLGFGDSWRILRDFTVLDNIADGPWYRAEIIKPKNLIAADDEWDYNFFIHIVEGIYQAAFIALACEYPDDSADAICAMLKKWSYGVLGYLRFDTDLISRSEKTFIYLRRSWFDDRFARFDAHIRNARGDLVAVVWHMEFERTRPPEKADSRPA